jgi:uncharacterized membrane protein YqgA involved in biofilm formation
MIGTWINVGTILLGSLIGYLSGRRIPERMNCLVMAAIGLVTLVIGVKLAIETQNVLVLLLSLDRGSFGEGFVTASLLFCIGPMAILGALRDGMYGDWQLLGLKAVMDGVSSVILVAGLGPGVIFSAFVVLVYQGGISLVAQLVSGPAAVSTLSQAPALIELDAVGGTILIALALKLLDLRDLKVENLLPALALAPLFVFLFHLVSR